MERAAVTQALADEIVVVSGLPRSGTSLMMAMLHAGGVPLLTDGQRKADADNPNGYFEFEAAKRVNSMGDWLAGAKGKAVKIVVPLVFQLPPALKYRILFMERNLDEVIASQAAMLRRMGRQPALPAEALKSAFARQLSRAREMLAPGEGRRIMFLNHRELIADPQSAAASIAGFLSSELDQKAMIAVVDPALHRQRVE